MNYLVRLLHYWALISRRYQFISQIYSSSKEYGMVFSGIRDLYLSISLLLLLYVISYFLDMKNNSFTLRHYLHYISRQVHSKNRSQVKPWKIKQKMFFCVLLPKIVRSLHPRKGWWLFKNKKTSPFNHFGKECIYTDL